MSDVDQQAWNNHLASVAFGAEQHDHISQWHAIGAAIEAEVLAKLKARIDPRLAYARERFEDHEYTYWRGYYLACRAIAVDMGVYDEETQP